MRKWCDECQTLVEPVLRPAEMEREGGSGQERPAAPLVETCPHDPGTGCTSSRSRTSSGWVLGSEGLQAYRAPNVVPPLISECVDIRSVVREG